MNDQNLVMNVSKHCLTTSPTLPDLHMASMIETVDPRQVDVLALPDK
jgi:hypothetical protein